MGLDQFDEPAIRQRNIASNYSDTKIASDLNNNGNVNSEDQFDAEITTLNNNNNAKEAIANAEKLPQDLANEKLKEIGAATPILPSEIGTDFNFKREIVWSNAIGFLVLHLCAVFGVGLGLFGFADYRTIVYSIVLVYGSGLGITMGAHRLWSHRSFKATLPLKVFLLWLHTLAGQNCLYVWVRDHRQHHKFSDTDADPHNANRGFFFSHVGWLMSRKHPKVIEYGKKIDMADLEADKWIMFQKNHYKVLYTIFSLLLPTAVPVVCWGEDKIIALFVAFFARSVIQLNATWSVNSVAHLFGTRPFDKTMFPVESMFVAFFAAGEGWHNYHHAFPWDYRASELGSPLNMTGFLIDKLADWGYISDRKSASHQMIKNRVMRTGDESHKVYGSDEGRSSFKTLWGIWRHPSNPTYNSIYSPKPKIINEKGYALIPDELSINELDDELLSKENAELEKTAAIMKYIVNKNENATGELSENLNNNEPTTKEPMANGECSISKDKNALNLAADEALLIKL